MKIVVKGEKRGDGGGVRKKGSGKHMREALDNDGVAGEGGRKNTRDGKHMRERRDENCG